MNATSSGLTLEELNAEERRYYMGGIILVSILSAVGIVGNVHVLVIYIFRTKPSNHRIFIIFLGVLDLIACAVAMPFVISNFVHPFTFYDSTMCKILTFYNYFICFSSVLILIVIVVDRYRKICVPHGNQMSHRVAKVMCAVATVIALLFSWPGFVMYGSTSIQTRDPGIRGYECNIRSELMDTWYPIIFNGILLVVAISCFIVLVTLYGIIGKVIWNHRHFGSQTEYAIEITNEKTDEDFEAATINSGTTSLSETNQNDGQRTKETNIDTVAEKVDKNAEKVSERSSVRTSQSVQTLVQRSVSKFNRTKRTTFMLFLITLFFLLSYIPYLILRLVYYTNEHWYPNMTFSGKVAYNTFLWCVYINNIANPLIYGFCDQRFRQEIEHFYNSKCCRNK